MVFRKIIGFGDSSYVISLPKEWIKSHSLSKGDSVNVEDDGGILRIHPQDLKQNSTKKEITINFDGNFRVLKSELFNSYINDYNIINIHKKDIAQYQDKIRELVNNFIAIDVIQVSEDRVVIKDYLNISEVSIYDTIRRIDRIILSMFDDVKSALNGELGKEEQLKLKDEDVNRLYNLILKLLKKAINPGDRKILNLQMEEIFYYWDLIISIEEVGDQLKRMSRYINRKADKRLCDLFEQVFEHYKKAIKANFSNNEQLALEIMNMRKEISDLCEKYSISGEIGSSLVLERIKSIHHCSGNIARSYIKLGIKTKDL